MADILAALTEIKLSVSSANVKIENSGMAVMYLESRSRISSSLIIFMTKVKTNQGRSFCTPYEISTAGRGLNYEESYNDAIGKSLLKTESLRNGKGLVVLLGVGKEIMIICKLYCR